MRACPSKPCGAVAHLTIRNGKQNVLDFATMTELRDALIETERHRSISTVVLRGEGEHFSAGVDIPSHAKDTAADMLGRFHCLIRTMMKTRKVLVAEVRGNCLGGGAELALMCDIVYTADDARWGFPEIKLGCFPPLACAALAACVGQKRAAEMILTGETFTGSDAARYGLANKAVPEDHLRLATAECLDRLARLSPAALRHTKGALGAWNAAHLEQALVHAETIYRDELIPCEDMNEGIRAWVEKRDPRWTGR